MQNKPKCPHSIKGTSPYARISMHIDIIMRNWCLIPALGKTHSQQ